jgi:mannose-6-phosphate isomerase
LHPQIAAMTALVRNAGELSDPGLRFRGWLTEQALPLWTTVGYDTSTALFHERLSLALSPLATTPRRLMVQARQITVCCLATEKGWSEATQLAVDTGLSMIERFWAADEEPGWVFSVHADAGVANATRDLYAHAFVLLSLAFLLRIVPSETAFEKALRSTLVYLDGSFADGQFGGFWDSIPRADDLRRQNPHMHLLEALLELYEVTGERQFLDRSRALVQLALAEFIDSRTGALREEFNDRWSSTTADQAIVEPGHQFEWAWLLRRYQTFSNHAAPIDAAIEPLIEWGLTGTDRRNGRIIDRLNGLGEVQLNSSRCWPHCEAIKLLSIENSNASEQHRELATKLWQRLLTSYCREDLRGGWIDQLDTQDLPVSADIPASTLYHLTFAFAEWEKVFAKHGPAERTQI